MISYVWGKKITFKTIFLVQLTVRHAEVTLYPMAMLLKFIHTPLVQSKIALMTVVYIHNMTKHCKTNQLKYPRTKHAIGQAHKSGESHFLGATPSCTGMDEQ